MIERGLKGLNKYIQQAEHQHQLQHGSGGPTGTSSSSSKLTGSPSTNLISNHRGSLSGSSEESQRMINSANATANTGGPPRSVNPLESLLRKKVNNNNSSTNNNKEQSEMSLMKSARTASSNNIEETKQQLLHSSRGSANASSH